MGSTGATVRLGPVEEGRRIDAIDAARGLALLGILCVNIHFFAAPFGAFLELTPPAGSGVGDTAAFFFVKFFCESKFYPLFSTLFGAGLVIMAGRARGAGRAFVPLYLRRLGFLMLLGLCHAVLLWYGDILFIYGVAGVILLACHTMSARAMTIAGTVIITLSAVGGAAFSTLMVAGSAPSMGEVSAPSPAGGEGAPETGAEVPSESTPAPGVSSPQGAPGASPSGAGSDAPTPPKPGRATEPPLPSGPPSAFRALMEGFKSGAVMEEAGKRRIAPMQTSLWQGGESEAFRDGPYLHAVAIRALNYAVMLFFVLAGFGWSVIAMFFFGAAMMKSGLFEPGRLVFHRRIVVLAGAIGLPLAIAGPIVLAGVGPKLWVVLCVSLGAPLAGPLVALGYLSGVRLLVASGRLKAVTAVLAAMGRMALTNYLVQTVVATTIFYHFGLRLFGEVGQGARLGIVAAVYLAQAVVSVWWLRRFRFGPMEWVWRTATYLKAQPMRRGGSGEDAAATS